MMENSFGYRIWVPYNIIKKTTTLIILNGQKNSLFS
jgi:hypothetical protein